MAAPNSSDDPCGDGMEGTAFAVAQAIPITDARQHGSGGDEEAYGDADGGEEYDDDEGMPYKPPGNSQDGEKASFGSTIPKGFKVPSRLEDKPYELIEAANDWHYAMMNDHPRNVFFRDCLREVVTSDSVVLEIGAGSGLLSIIAASLGARCVVAIEANRHLASVAREIIRRNGYEGRIHIINKMSTEVDPLEVDAYGGRPTVLLSEILGTLMLGESALHYVMDARERLVAPGAAVVPRAGRQFAALVQSEDVASITSVRSWEGIDLHWFNTLQDTTSMVFTKQYGFRFSSCAYAELAPKTPVLAVDFATDAVGTWRGEKRARFQATKTGTVHAVLASWEVYDAPAADGRAGGQGDGRAGAQPAEGQSAGGSAQGSVHDVQSAHSAHRPGDTSTPKFIMSTHPDATLHNFPRAPLP